MNQKKAEKRKVKEDEIQRERARREVARPELRLPQPLDEALDAARLADLELRVRHGAIRADGELRERQDGVPLRVGRAGGQLAHLQSHVIRASFGRH